jgi:hypothetical protein
MTGVVSVTVPVVVMVSPFVTGPNGVRPHWPGTRAVTMACVLARVTAVRPGREVVVVDVDVVVGEDGTVVVASAWLGTVLEVGTVGAFAVASFLVTLLTLSTLTSVADVVEVVEVDVVEVDDRTVVAVVLVVVGADAVIRDALPDTTVVEGVTRVVEEVVEDVVVVDAAFALGAA